tara:strand:- start:710 stop:1915 length:1206 start_codon:yes stop_codon:yes gene_type:complete
MPNLESIDGVAAASVEAVNGVAKANIEAVNGTSVPAAATGATRWVVATQNGYLAHAADSDTSSWSSYDAFDESSETPTTTQSAGDSESIAFGRNASGGDVYLATRSQENPSTSGTKIREITISGSDVTASGEWGNIDVDGDDNSKAIIMQVLWSARSDGTAAGTWLAVGKQGSGNVYRSTDGGSTFSAVDISGLSGHQSGNNNMPYINGVASDGQGNWMFAQSSRIYFSDTDGASFAVSTPFSSDTPGRFQAIAYTNNTWVLVYSRSSTVRYRTCSASDITDWSDEVTAVNVQHTATQGKAAKITAANGTVCVAMENDTNINYFTVDGKTIGTVNDVSGFSNIRGLATDGEKWIAACNGGDLYEAATADLSSWTQRLDGFQADGSSALNFEAVCGNVTYPL